MDTITGARTRLYMSIDSLISAIDLLNNLLQLLLEGAELLKTQIDSELCIRAINLLIKIHNI